MTAIVHIEIDFFDEYTAKAEFPEIEKVFLDKAKGTMVRMAKPKIFLDKTKICVEMDLWHKTLAKGMLGWMSTTLRKNLEEKYLKEGREIKVKCTLKKEPKEVIQNE